MRGKARTIIIIVLLLLAVAGCIFLLGRGLGRAEAAERPPSIKQELITLLSESTLAHRVREWFSVGMEYEKAASGESVSVRDLTSLYRNDREERVLYLTIQKGTEKENTNHSWEDLNAYPLDWYAQQGISPYECEALVQFGNEVGPVMGKFGFGDTVANATVRLTGSSASTRPQKSYRIIIKDGAGDVEGMKNFILSKGVSDPFRFADKLCYELMSENADMLSARTSFVHLYVRDASDKDGDSGLYVDYGLYTMVETVNKRYLKNRGLGADCELYKAVDFDFERHEDAIMQPTEAAYDKDRFETLLESKGDDDYTKLIALLEDLQDEEQDIRQLVKRWFREENIYTWMAFQILLDNPDTGTENFYLYSPTGSDTFYIIPWDNDNILRRDYEALRDPDYAPGWKQGIFRFQGSLLFRRMMQSRGCTNTLGEYVTALHESILSPEHVSEKAEELAEIVIPQLYDMPDAAFARVTEENYRRLLERLPEQIDENFYTYYDTLETPWPFHIHAPERTGNRILLSWDTSYVMDGTVRYSVEVDDAWDFLDPVVREENVADTSLAIGMLKPGQYFLRVQAQTENGYVQCAFENYYTEKKTTARGVYCFYVLEDGSVVGAAY